MKKAKLILRKLLYPKKVILFMLPALSFTALVFIFVTGQTESLSAYPVYCMSAYSLVILIVALPRLFNRIKSGAENSRLIKKLSSSSVGKRYISDMSFRGGFGIYQGMAVNFLYAAFRIITGILYSSVWFISRRSIILFLAE